MLYNRITLKMTSKRKKKKDKNLKLKMCLESVYFAKTENSFLKILQNGKS